MLLINAWKVAGALIIPKGITKYLKYPQRVRKAVFYLFFFFILIWLYILGISNFVNYFTFWSLSCNSKISGNRQLFFTVILFNSRQSTHNLNIPSFFDTKIIGYSAGDINSQINLFCWFVSKYSLKASSFSADKGYIGFLLSIFSGKSLIL